MKTIYTIGTNKSTPTVLLSVLLQYNINHLYDIRRNNNSVFGRCRGRILERLFSKVRNIEYRWVPELAPSRKLLKEEKEYGWDPNKYLAEIGDEGLKRATDLITGSPVPCFLCAETIYEIGVCHRKSLLDTITENNPGAFNIKHLDGRRFFKESLESLKLSKGRYSDLINIFTSVNEEYFKNRYKKENIYFGWEEMPSQMKRYRVLAYFRYPNQIIFNHVLDQANIPEPVIRSVMYHEMLHLDRAHGGLPAGHTVDFYMDEARFREYAIKFNFDFESAWSSLLGGGQ